MAYLVSDICIEKLKVYDGKKTFLFSNEVEVFEDEFRLEMKSEKEADEHYLPDRIIIKHSKLWFNECKIFGRRECVFIPALIVKIISEDETLELVDRVLLNDHIGFGMDVKDFLLGSHRNRYKMIYNGLNASLERLREDSHRLVNYTLDRDITDYATRGFLDELLRLRDKVGNFDFDVVE